VKKFDYIIIGCGSSGLYSAINIPSDKSVLLLSKDRLKECNTHYAQGGIAFSIDEDDIIAHKNDTIIAGANQNSIDSVELLTQNSQEVLKHLVSLGFEFDKDSQGNLLFTKEAAHSVNRILHANGDATGKVLHDFLLDVVKSKENIKIVKNRAVIDLLIKDNICYGVTASYKNKFKNYYANNTIIASGGIGALFKYNTNAKKISADLQGICIEKGIKLKDMHLLQFHPTVFIDNKYSQKSLLTEALRGEGAYIVDEDNKRFVFDYHKDGELAPRSVVSQAIYDHKQKTNKEVFLSFENFDKKFFKNRFPNIYKNFKKIGFDLPKDKIPISPAFHYCMGGIDVDLDSKVKGFSNLYAVGEVACNGVHGANRLASNSLLETFVFAKICINNSLKNDTTRVECFDKVDFCLVKPDDQKLKKQLREIMWNSVGIIRSDTQLRVALSEVLRMLKLDIGRNLKLRLLTARNVIISAIDNDSIGAHYKV
jgi:L-aspartate oxidase